MLTTPDTSEANSKNEHLRQHFTSKPYSEPCGHAPLSASYQKDAILRISPVHSSTTMPPDLAESWQGSPNEQLNTNGKRANDEYHEKQPAKRLAKDNRSLTGQSTDPVGHCPPQRG